MEDINMGNIIGGNESIETCVIPESQFAAAVLILSPRDIDDIAILAPAYSPPSRTLGSNVTHQATDERDRTLVI